jgi:hypothetical protein
MDPRVKPAGDGRGGSGCITVSIVEDETQIVRLARRALDGSAIMNGDRGDLIAGVAIDKPQKG